MDIKNLRRLAVGSVAGLTLAAGLAWSAGFPVQTAFAQSDTQVEQQGSFFEMRGGKMGRGGFGHGGFENRGGGERGGNQGGLLLANALGVTPVQLQEAHQSAQNALIDQAAAAGVITAEQATQLKDGQRPTGDVSGLRTYMADVDRDAALAQALDITPQALTAAKDSQVQKGVEAGLITQEQGNQMLLHQKIQAATQAAVEQAINEAVAEGLITQEEADAMKSAPGGGPGPGSMRGHKGHGGMHDRGPSRGQGRGGSGGIFGGIFGGGFNNTPDAPAPGNASLNDA